MKKYKNIEIGDRENGLAGSRYLIKRPKEIKACGLIEFNFDKEFQFTPFSMAYNLEELTDIVDFMNLLKDGK